MLSSADTSRCWWAWDAIVLVLAASVVLTSVGLIRVDHSWWTGLVGIVLSLISFWRIASQCRLLQQRPSYNIDGRDGLLTANCAERGDFSCWKCTSCYVPPHNDTELKDYCCVQSKCEIAKVEEGTPNTKHRGTPHSFGASSGRQAAIAQNGPNTSTPIEKLTAEESWRNFVSGKTGLLGRLTPNVGSAMSSDPLMSETPFSSFASPLPQQQQQQQQRSASPETLLMRESLFSPDDPTTPVRPSEPSSMKSSNDMTDKSNRHHQLNAISSTPRISTPTGSNVEASATSDSAAQNLRIGILGGDSPENTTTPAEATTTPSNQDVLTLPSPSRVQDDFLAQGQTTDCRAVPSPASLGTVFDEEDGESNRSLLAEQEQETTLEPVIVMDLPSALGNAAAAAAADSSEEMMQMVEDKDDDDSTGSLDDSELDRELEKVRNPPPLSAFKQAFLKAADDEMDILFSSKAGHNNYAQEMEHSTSSNDEDLEEEATSGEGLHALSPQHENLEVNRNLEEEDESEESTDDDDDDYEDEDDEDYVPSPSS